MRKLALCLLVLCLPTLALAGTVGRPGASGDPVGSATSCADGEAPTASSGVYTCQAPSAAGNIDVENNETLIDGATTVIDFSSEFTVTSSPAGEANVSIDDIALGNLDDVCGGANQVVEWQSGTPVCINTPSGGGSALTVSEDDTPVDTTIDTIDFGSGFDVTESPEDEVNIVLDYTEDPVNLASGEISGILADGNVAASLSRDSEAVAAGDISGSLSGGYTIDANSVDQDELAATITFAPADNIILPIEASDQLTDGEIDFDSTEEVIEVGDDGVETLKFYPGQHTVELNNLESIDPPNVQDDEVYVGDGAGSGVWIGISNSSGATQKLQYSTASNTFMVGTDDDIPEAGDFGAATDLDANGLINASAITTGKVADDELLEVDLDAVDTPGDEECLTYESGAGGDFEWQACSGGEVNNLETDDPPNVQDDEVYVGTGAAAGNWTGLPDSDGATQKLQYDQGTGTFSVGTDDDVPEAGDFGAAADLDANGEIVADTVGTAELNDLSDTANTSHIVAIDSASSAAFEYLAPGNAITNSSGSLNVEIKDNAENGVGSSSSVSGLEFESTELTLLQGCGDNEILKWDEGTDTWVCEPDVGANADGFGTIGAATADAADDTMTAGANDGIGLSTDTTNDPEDISTTFDYSNSLAGNPALGAEELVFSTDGTGGGGIIAEGSVADTFEGLFLLPDVTGADSTQTIVTDQTELFVDSTGELHPRDTTNHLCDDASCTDWEITDEGDATFNTVDTTDQTAEPGNRITLRDNDTLFTNDPTCANSGVANRLVLIDADETAAERWVVCDGTTELHEFGQLDGVMASGTSLPGTCTVGELFQDTDADTDGSVYFCRATNTWKEIDDDGGAGAGEWTDSTGEIHPTTTTNHVCNDASCSAWEIQDTGVTTWTGDMTLSEGTPVIEFDDTDTAGATARIAIIGSAGPDVQMTLSVDEDGSLLNYMTLDGVAEDVSLSKPLSFGAAAAEPEQARYFPAWSMNSDGTQCADPTGVTINSGPLVGAIVCTDDNAATMYFDYAPPDNWDAGTFTVKVHATNLNATPSGNLEYDIDAQCRGDSDVINNTWGTAVNDIMGFTTQYDLEVEESGAITPNGTCAVGDHVFFRIQIDAPGTTTEVADTNILGITLGYTIVDLDEVD